MRGLDRVGVCQSSSGPCDPQYESPLSAPYAAAVPEHIEANARDESRLSGRNMPLVVASPAHRFAFTLRTVGVFPMTHHVECVALLERAT